MLGYALILIGGILMWLAMSASSSELAAMGFFFCGFITLIVGICIAYVKSTKRHARPIIEACEENGLKFDADLDSTTNVKEVAFINENLPWYVKGVSTINVRVKAETSVAGHDLRIYNLIEQRNHGLKAGGTCYTTAYVVTRQQEDLPTISLRNKHYINRYNYRDDDFYFGGISPRDNSVFQYHPICNQAENSAMFDPNLDTDKYDQQQDEDKPYAHLYGFIESGELVASGFPAASFLKEYSYVTENYHVDNFKNRITMSMAAALFMSNFSGVDISGRHIVFFQSLYPIDKEEVNAHLYHVKKFIAGLDRLKI